MKHSCLSLLQSDPQIAYISDEYVFLFKVKLHKSEKNHYSTGTTPFLFIYLAKWINLPFNMARLQLYVRIAM